MDDGNSLGALAGFAAMRISSAKFRKRTEIDDLMFVTRFVAVSTDTNDLHIALPQMSERRGQRIIDVPAVALDPLNQCVLVQADFVAVGMQLLALGGKLRIYPIRMGVQQK